MDDLDRIARVCHEAVRAYKQALGEEELPPWDEAPEWQVVSTRAAAQGPDRADDLGRPAPHAPGLFANGEDLVAPLASRYADHGGLVDHDALAPDEHKRVRGTQIDCQVSPAAAAETNRAWSSHR